MDEPLDEFKPIEKLDLRKFELDLPETVQHISCPSCGRSVSAENLSLDTGMAKCGGCNAIFSIEQEIEKVKKQAKSETKQIVLRPEGIDLFQFRNELNITVQPHLQGLNLAGVILAPAVAVLSIMLYFSDKTDFTVLIPFAFCLVSVYFFYKALTNYRNRVYIDVTGGSLSIKSRPKNFKKDREFQADEIEQLYLKHSTDAPGHFRIYLLVNGPEGQRHEPLLTVNSLSKAKYLEQEIERYLEIEDKKVPEATA